MARRRDDGELSSGSVRAMFYHCGGQPNVQLLSFVSCEVGTRLTLSDGVHMTEATLARPLAEVAAKLRPLCVVRLLSQEWRASREGVKTGRVKRIKRVYDRSTVIGCPVMLDERSWMQGGGYAPLKIGDESSPPLRFSVGDWIECVSGVNSTTVTGWKRGQITAVRCAEASERPVYTALGLMLLERGRCAAYCVQMEQRRRPFHVIADAPDRIRMAFAPGLPSVQTLARYDAPALVNVLREHHDAEEKFVGMVLALLHRYLAQPIEPQSVFNIDAAAHASYPIDRIATVVAAGGVEAVLGALRAHASTPQIAMLSCTTLVLFCGSGLSAPNAARAFVASGGAVEVARALRENIEDANMQLGGVTLVRYLFHLFANGVEEPALAAKDGGCIEAVLASLMRYPDHPHIAKEGIDTIMRACISIHEGSSDTTASRRRLVGAGVVGAIVSVMHKQLSSTSLLEHCCHCLCFLAAHFSARDAMVEAETAQALVDALDVCTEAEGALTEACIEALHLLCDVPGGPATHSVFRLSDSDGEPDGRLRTALLRHPERDRLQEVGASLLHQLSMHALVAVAAVMSMTSPP